MTRPHVIMAAVAVLLAALAPASARAATSDPALDQEIDASQQVATGPWVLTAGHVDIGPRFDDGTWTLMVHDDLARDGSGTSVWREPSQTVLHVLDAARLSVPDDDAYDFLGAAPGGEVWVVPQTQNPDVVWVGWNTQDPSVMAAVDRGVTLSLAGVQGPGTVTVYLQAGAFGEPDLLWDSRLTDPQPIWVDINTHTHANWVFTEPGVYLLRVVVEAALLDGTTLSDTQYLRFAVGSDTSPDEALAAVWTGPAEPTAAQDQEEAGSPDPILLVGGIAVLLLALVVALGVVAVRERRLRRRALAGEV